MSTLTKKIHEAIVTVKDWFELFPKTRTAINFVKTIFWIIMTLYLTIACALLTFWSVIGAFVMLDYACYEPYTICNEAFLIVSAVAFGFASYLAIKRLYISRFC